MAASVTAAEMKRTINAAKECGLVIYECVMTRGRFRIITSKDDIDQPKNSNDTSGPKAWPEVK